MSVAIYNIPETEKGTSAESGKWLSIVLVRTLSPDTRALLEKICAALKADLDRDAMMVIYEGDNLYPVPPDVRLVISFGAEPSGLGVHIDLNETGIRFLESFAFILTGTLEDLAASAPLKKQLWSSMQDFLEESKTHD